MFHIDLFQVSALQLLGVAGALAYVVNYTLLTLRIVSTESVAYFAVNLCAASMVLLSLGHAFNAAALIVQVFFIGVSLCGIASRLSRARRIARRPDRLRPLL